MQKEDQHLRHRIGPDPKTNLGLGAIATWVAGGVGGGEAGKEVDMYLQGGDRGLGAEESWGEEGH